jgi:hypothetical protein
MRSQLLFLALLLGACATQQLQITGRYAGTLSKADIRDIRLLVATRHDLGRTLKSLEVAGPDRVRVEAGHYTGPRAWLGKPLLCRSTQWCMAY